jgi:hypothetical protein
MVANSQGVDYYSLLIASQKKLKGKKLRKEREKKTKENS